MDDQNKEGQNTTERLQRLSLPAGHVVKVQGLPVTLMNRAEIEASASTIERIGSELRLYTGASER